jgi:transposase
MLFEGRTMTWLEPERMASNETTFVFRGRAGSLIKALWHDGIGLSLCAKRLDRGRFVWPATVDGVVALSAAPMSYLLEAIDWRIRSILGDRRARARLKKSSGVRKKSPQIADFVIPSAS